MQLYRELRVLTARPTVAEEARRAASPLRRPAGGRAGQRRLVAGARRWREMAAVPLPILCGGTGLYFLSLTEGLSALPPVPAAARGRGPGAHWPSTAPPRSMPGCDAETAAGLRPGDSQRLARAYEVLLGTGRGLAAWQREGAHTGPAPWRFAAIRLDPPREALRAAIAARFDAMLGGGALEEVRALAALGLDPALPAMRAHGVPELMAHIRAG